MTAAGSAELVVAANRGPFSLVAAPDGSLRAERAGGGLAPSLAGALAGGADATWVAAALTEAERKAAAAGPIDSVQEGLSLRLVALEAEVLSAAYDVVANSVLWFVFHGLFDASRRPVFATEWRLAWEGYQRYNLAFAEAIAQAAAPEAVVLVNDYHLLLAGAMLREARPDLRTVHFSHTPFPSPEELDMLPGRTVHELVSGMGGYGACGFHSRRWEDAFRRCLAGKTTLPETFVAPLGPDLGRLREVAESGACAERMRQLGERFGDRRLVVRSDRLELSKNLLRGLRAFDLLLQEHPEWRRRVVHLVRGYVSRQGLPEYLAYRSEVEHLADLVNERWSDAEYTAVVVDIGDDFASTVAALRSYDVLLVNPVRDGMNLVAKEGPVLNERDGMLVLSRQAGAYDELGPACFGVHAFDVSETAEALHAALSLGPPDRAGTAARLAELAAAHPPADWLGDVLLRARAPGTGRPDSA